MAERRPSFPFYPKDWIASTRGLSAAARGYYIDMLALSWLNGGCDTDPETLRRSVGAEKAEWRRVWPELAPRWQECDGRLVNRRLERTREEAHAYTEAKRLAGQKGGKAKAHAKQTPSKQLAEGVAETYPPSALPSPSPVTTTVADAPVVVARAPNATPFDVGAMPTRRRKAHCAHESAIGLDVPQFLHDELAAKLSTAGVTDANAALRAWYRETEADVKANQTDVGEDALDFWRQRYREWRGRSTPRKPVEKEPDLSWAAEVFPEEYAKAKGRAS